MKPLTNKQKRFADEYLIDLNGTQAAIRAGYSKHAAKEIGYENLTKPHIQIYLGERQQALEEERGVTIKLLIDGLVDTYQRCRQKIAVLDVEGKETGVWRFDAPSAIRCLELLGKHLGMFKDKLELTGKDSKPIEIDTEDFKARLVDKLTKLTARKVTGDSAPRPSPVRASIC